MKYLFILAVLMTAAPALAADTIEDSMENRLRYATKLVIMTNEATQMEQMFGQLDAMILQAIRQTPCYDEAREQENLSILDKSEMMENINIFSVKLYAKYFTAHELGQLVGFYRSELGQKMLKNSVAITAETIAYSVQLSQQWQQQAAEKVQGVMQGQSCDTIL